MTEFFSHSQKKKNTVLLVYDLPEELHLPENNKIPLDATAEWESKRTIEKIRRTWEAVGFAVISMPVKYGFLKLWVDNISRCTFVHSLVEGFGSLSREAWIPSLCEFSGVPCLGSSPFAHTLAMSKIQVKFLCLYLGIPTAPFYIIKQREDLSLIPKIFLQEPHFIKPDGEGSGMGIDKDFSLSTDFTTTQKTVSHLLDLYPDGLLIEKALTGKEYTVGFLGSPVEQLPIAEIEVPGGVYGYANKSKDCMDEKITFPRLDPKIQWMIQTGSAKLFQYLQMYDFARFDWKCDGKGEVFFLEANTLPGLSYYYSVFPLLAKQAGYSYKDLFVALSHSVMRRVNSRPLWYGNARVWKK